MVWALDLDDFRGSCGDGKHPLLTQINRVLKSNTNELEGRPIFETTEAVPIAQSPGKEDDCSTIQIAQSNINSIENEQNEVNEPSNNNGDDEFLTSEQSSSEFDSSNTFKVVCYFTNWAWYRQNGGKYLPEDINANLCSHIVYGFAVLNRETLTIQPHDAWADLDNHFYERVTAYRAKGIKVSVAIGGWNDSAGDKYARLVRSSSARSRFIKTVMNFIEKYGFDGLDLDWEYPVCWQVDCTKGNPQEKESFVEFVQELSQAFHSKGWLLSSAVSPNKKVIDAGYDVSRISKYMDWIAVMTYDYHGQWDKKTGHVAPMYHHPEGTDTFNANFSINYWLQKGADRKKIVMGMPMYGQSFTLANANQHGLNAPSYGGGEAGESTRARGFLSYYEICDYIRNRKWNVVRDPKGRMGPYAYLRDQWVSFDDAAMIRHKAEYVKAMDLGGAMIWALDLDDFHNRCDCESYPLLKTINRVLRNYQHQPKDCILEQQDKTFIGDNDETKPIFDTNEFQDTNSIFANNLVPNQPSFNVVKEPEESIYLTDHSINPESTSTTRKNCQNRNYAAHESDCNKYYICQHGTLLEQKCPVGLHWNENHCDWPQATKCDIDTNMVKSGVNFNQLFNLNTMKRYPLEDNNVSQGTSMLSTISVIDNNFGPLDERCDFKLVCYFTNWAWYRPEEGRFLPEDIDVNLCTHIVYGFAVLDKDTLTIKSHDMWTDIDNQFYKRVLAYKSKGVRVLLALGGWNDSLGDKYARMVLNNTNRHRFVKNAVNFVEKYGFEGLDLDWEFPVCWQVDCSKGSPEEKAGFAHLIQELSESFKPRGLLLSAAVSPSKYVIDLGYDVPALAKYLDWVAIMSYDYHGHWDRQTGHVSPLYQSAGDELNPYFNSNYTVHYWIANGAPAHKLVLGMPMYGQTFTLADHTRTRLNDNTIGPGQAGNFTRASGFMAYYEICELTSSESNGWTVIRDQKGHIGPYAFNNNQWVSYDDVDDIRRKAQYIRNMGLGGGMIWSLDLDDFRGRCGCGKYPLLRTLNYELRCISAQMTNNCT